MVKAQRLGQMAISMSDNLKTIATMVKAQCFMLTIDYM